MLEEKLFETLNTLIQTGGSTAIVVIAIYYGTAVLKYAIGFGCILLGIGRFCKTWKEIRKGQK